MATRIHQDVFIALLLLISAIVSYAMTSEFAQEATYPRALCLALGLLSCLLLVSGVRKGRAQAGGKTVAREEEEEPLTLPLLSAPGAALALICGYLLLVAVLGFFPATLVFITLFSRFMGIKHWPGCIALALGFSLFAYPLFVLQLGVPLPSGAWA